MYVHVISAIALVALSWDYCLAVDKLVTKLQPSHGLTEVLDIDEQGNLVYRREVLQGNELIPTLYSRVDGVEKKVSTPVEFTTINAFRISNTKKLVGYAGRVFNHPKGNQQAVVWDLKNNQAQLLPHPKSFRTSSGLDISSDGKRVSGYAIGRDPARMMPCIWEFKDEKWIPLVLDAPIPYNPFLMGGKVAINEAGTMVAANLLVKKEGTRANHLFIWEIQDGKWQEFARHPQAVRIGNINNHGTVVGTIRIGNRFRGWQVDRSGKSKTFEPLKGDASVHFNDINNHGITVGFSDDPPGPKGGPQAIVVVQGKLRPLALSSRQSESDEFSSLTSVNDKSLASGFKLFSPQKPGDFESTSAIVVQLEN